MGLQFCGTRHTAFAYTGVSATAALVPTFHLVLPDKEAIAYNCGRPYRHRQPQTNEHYSKPLLIPLNWEEAV